MPYVRLFRKAFSKGAVVVLVCLIQQPAAAQVSSEPAFVEMPGPEVWQYPRPESPWLAEQQTRAMEALESLTFDVLVVPTQARGMSLDAHARSLMTLQLVSTLSDQSDLKVADPVLVSQALGAHRRQFDAEDVSGLAEKLGVSKIVISDVTHDGGGKFRYRMGIRAPGESLELGIEGDYFSGDLAFNDQIIPYFRFNDIAPQVAERIAGELAWPKVFSIDAEVVDFPEDVASFASPENDLLAAHYLQFMGVLSSRRIIDRPRDMMFERSLVLLGGVTDESAHWRLLYARALFYSNRRPVAVALIPDPKTPEERAFVAFLNGDLDALQDELSNIESPLLATIARIESERLRYQYDGAEDIDLARASYDENATWGLMVYTAMLDEFVWQSFSPYVVKVAADVLLPIDRFSMQTLQASKSVTDEEPDAYEIAELTLRHAKTSDRDEETPPGSLLGPRLLDVTDTLRAQIVGQIYLEISRWHRPQGRPDYSIAAANYFEPLMAGHPSYLIMASTVTGAEAQKKRGAEQVSFQRRRHQLMRDGIITNEGLSADSLGYSLNPDWAFHRYSEYPRATKLLLTYVNDWPMPPGPVQGGDSHFQAVANLNCVERSNSDIRCLYNLKSLFNGSDEGRVWLLDMAKKTEHRFKGSAYRASVIGGIYLLNNEEEAANSIFDEVIESGSMEWMPYETKALEHIREQRSNEALEVFQRYPGFADENSTSRVSLANAAHDAGIALFMAGHYDLAIPLYRLSASYQSGSYKAILSEAHLALIEADYEEAIKQSLQNIRAYDSRRPRLDVIGLALITDQEDVAKAVADGATDVLDSAVVWDGLLVANRAANMETDLHLRWSFETAEDVDGKERLNAAVRYSLLSAVLDRNGPDSDVVALMESLDSREPTIRLGTGETNRHGNLVAAPTYVRTRLPVGPNEPDSTIRSFGVSMTEAMVAINRREYKEARLLLDSATDYFDLGMFLPFYAIASMKENDSARLEDYLESLQTANLQKFAKNPTKDGVYFSEFVTKAVISAFEGMHDDAIDLLRRAAADVPWSDEQWIYPRYVLSEVGRILFEESGDEQYRYFTVGFARTSAVYQPYMAYNHAFIAMMSNDREERVTALARVLTLDPQSRSISKANEDELAAAIKLAEEGYPMPPNSSLDDLSAGLAR